MRKTAPVTLLLGFALIGAASAASALGPGSSWSEIRSTPNVSVRAPLIFFGTTGIPVTEVCVVAGKFRPLNRDRVASEVAVAARPLGYDINVEELYGNGERQHARLLFRKHLDVPACT